MVLLLHNIDGVTSTKYWWYYYYIILMVSLVQNINGVTTTQNIDGITSREYWPCCYLYDNVVLAMAMPI